MVPKPSPVGIRLTIEDQRVRSEPAIRPAPGFYTLYGGFTSNAFKKFQLAGVTLANASSAKGFEMTTGVPLIGKRMPKSVDLPVHVRRILRR